MKNWIGIITILTKKKNRASINVSSFRKYDPFFPFHNVVFATYLENHNTNTIVKKRFSLTERFFLAGTNRNDFNVNVL